MQRTLLMKIIVIGFLSLLLLIPLAMIENKIDERKHYRDNVERDIANSWSHQQVVTGPVLVIPYKEYITDSKWDSNLNKYIDEKILQEKTTFLLPETITIISNIETEQRYRGIYKIPVYTADISFSGDFQIPENFGVELNNREIYWEDAYVAIGVSDIRGVRSKPELTWSNKWYPFEPDSKIQVLQSGIHAALGSLDPHQVQSHSFSFNLKLAGMKAIEFIPIGKHTEVSMQSKWPHPSFRGYLLPEKREISSDGFNAKWQTSYFSTNIEKLFNECISGQCTNFKKTAFGTHFIESVDIYLQSERSVKYGILFVILTFVAFFLYEVLKHFLIHPIQYGLVGVALAIFYLLLISLSEQIGFLLAYTLSSIACITLISFYISYILKSVGRGCSFAGMLCLLYITLYKILQSEDFALLMGSILLFAFLTVIMVLTRNINWYEVGKNMNQRLTGHVVNN